MIRAEGWQNPLIEFRDVPFFIRIYEQIMLASTITASRISKGNPNPKVKHPVYAYGKGKETLIFEDKDSAAQYFKVSRNTIYNWAKDKQTYKGYHFKIVDPRNEQEVHEIENILNETNITNR